MYATNLRPSRYRNWQLLNSGEPLPKEKRTQVVMRQVLEEEYQIDRIISQKQCPDEGTLFLVKWKGYQLADCTWEPITHIPKPDLELFIKPEVCAGQLSAYANILEEAVQHRLSSTNSKISISFPTDVYRYVFGADANNTLLCLEDFSKLPLSSNWYLKLNCHGQGTKLNFPVRVHSIVREKNIFTLSDNKVVKKKVPSEKLQITSDTVVYSV